MKKGLDSMDALPQNGWSSFLSHEQPEMFIQAIAEGNEAHHPMSLGICPGHPKSLPDPILVLL
jgi:hypothetical protein